MWHLSVFGRYACVMGWTFTRRAGRRRAATVVEAIEQSREKLDQAETGDSVGLQLAEITRREITSGDILTSPV
jgi:translation elongation factor EF-Tu-like GTPase